MYVYPPFLSLVVLLDLAAGAATIYVTYTTICMGVDICMYIHAQTSLQVLLFLYIYVYMYMYIYMYICIYMYVYVYNEAATPIHVYI